MIFRREPSKPTSLETEIERVIALISAEKPDSDEYKAAVKQLQVLHQMKEAEKPESVSINTVLTVAANITGILVIVGHERAHVITSQAVKFVRTLR